ncbi:MULTISPECIES: flavin reductase family protein [unclassified Arthrobacter]|uniref:flavin reductase family protein n=1 Tax=unclassified Arthrobacter TaxID=235627 RepID=UPI001E5667C7|nr:MULTISPECIES: flavin reductase family protein [unclassified Arthrobacter]MCC9144227.1 flavin reductase family protein [Arthrobacter sp. zg-Y919]MDK1275452.1 flavin reductase family protein [Arthrobacter sp. zg.Y919]WIB03168.1 flavin reductase family protein [Arthrobacter sp. zg-Y919]
MTRNTALCERNVTDAFKDAFRAHPAGVAIITADGGSGPVGLTASSVSSVSAEPPILSFSLASTHGTAGVIAGSPTVVVHLLGAENAALAALFARQGADRFGATRTRTLPGGEPVLEEAPVALLCRVDGRVPVGSSILIAATVLEIIPGSTGQDPLVYHNRTYHRLGRHSALGESGRVAGGSGE